MVTAASIVLSVIAGLFRTNNEFPGKRLLVSLLTLPLAFPGVVVGFMVIMLAGRQGVIGDVSQALLGHKLVFAYSMSGLFLGYRSEERRVGQDVPDRVDLGGRRIIKKK